MKERELWKLLVMARFELGKAEADMLSARKSGIADSFGEPFRSRLDDARRKFEQLNEHWNQTNRKVP